MCFCSASSDLTLSMMNQRSKDEFTKNSLTPDCGTCLSHPHIPIGSTICLPTWPVLTTGGEFAASVCPAAYYASPQSNFNISRYLCVSPSLWGSWRYRPSDLRFPHISFDLSWDTTTQSSGFAVPLLSEADWHCNEPFEQQRSFLDIREESVTRFLQDRIECFLEHGRSSSVSFHEGNQSFMRGICPK